MPKSFHFAHPSPNLEFEKLALAQTAACQIEETDCWLLQPFAAIRAQPCNADLCQVLIRRQLEPQPPSQQSVHVSGIGGPPTITGTIAFAGLSSMEGKKKKKDVAVTHAVAIAHPPHRTRHRSSERHQSSRVISNSFGFSRSELSQKTSLSSSSSTVARVTGPVR
ncbi:hypothetical protein L209DRAFT_166960 [Thermothelomyces heterothallicus CBS 203.75]